MMYRRHERLVCSLEPRNELERRHRNFFIAILERAILDLSEGDPYIRHTTADWFEDEEPPEGTGVTYLQIVDILNIGTPYPPELVQKLEAVRNEVIIVPKRRTRYQKYITETPSVPSKLVLHKQQVRR